MKNFLLWLLAFVITFSVAFYQRMTGPTYPIRGEKKINETTVKFKLYRSHGGESDHEVKIKVENQNISGYIIYKRYKTDDSWTEVPMTRESVYLIGKLPHQPPAGKLLYKVMIDEISLTDEKPVIIRFRGDVPAAILILHVFFMFTAMFVSTRTGLQALDRSRNPRKYALWTTGLLFIGGMILGPLVQYFAFGDFWTGFPFGTDLTDNKTLIALIGWIAAVIAGRGGKPARGWVLGAAILLLVVYLIPHSLLGSELDYSKLNAMN